MTTTPEDNGIAFISLLKGIFFSILYVVFDIFLQNAIKHYIPTSFLVCSEGLLTIRPKGVEVTRWNEVNGIYNVSTSSERKYMLKLINRKNFTLAKHGRIWIASRPRSSNILRKGP